MKTRQVVQQGDRRLVDVAVVGGGPAGVAAALWVARYRRSVVLIDAGEQRNRWSERAHGYLGLDGVPPADVLGAARSDLDRYPEVQILDGRRVVDGRPDGDQSLELTLDDGTTIHARRVILATGVRDVFPDVERFEQFYGRSIVTCPSCDGYEAQGRAVAVVGDSPTMAEFELELLDWARSVVAVREGTQASQVPELARDRLPVADVAGHVVGIEGDDGQVTGLRLDSGRVVPCEIVFWLMHHEQQSDLPHRLGCEVTPEGCVAVDEHGATTVPNVFAAGDMTPGPHLVQIAAAKGATAGIAAATSLRGAGPAPLCESA